jgi:hypothetical protein
MERTYARDPYRQMGGYVKRCLGLNLYFKMENPAHHRIQELYVGGRPVKPDAVYSAAFVTTQGVPAKYGTARQALDVRAIDALKKYLNTHNPAQADLQNTVVAI